MINKIDKNADRKIRAKRVRRKVSGTPSVPRLNVFRSLSNISCQIIDDTKGVTLVSASSLDKDLKETLKHGGNIEAAKVIGKTVAEKALKAGICDVVFDTSNFPTHIPVNSSPASLILSLSLSHQNAGWV